MADKPTIVENNKGRQNKCSGAFAKSLTDREFNLKINKGLITGINIPYGGKDRRIYVSR